MEDKKEQNEDTVKEITVRDMSFAAIESALRHGKLSAKDTAYALRMATDRIWRLEHKLEKIQKWHKDFADLLD